MNTTYFLNLVAGNVFGSAINPAIPAGYYLGLSTTTPNINGTGVTEPASSAGYRRLPIETFTTPVNGVVKNMDVLTFPSSTGDWGYVTHYVIYDAQSGGNLLIYTPLKSGKTIEADTIAAFQKEEIEISVANAS